MSVILNCWLVCQPSLEFVLMLQLHHLNFLLNCFILNSLAVQCAVIIKTEPSSTNEVIVHDTIPTGQRAIG